MMIKNKYILIAVSIIYIIFILNKNKKGKRQEVDIDNNTIIAKALLEFINKESYIDKPTYSEYLNFLVEIKNTSDELISEAVHEELLKERALNKLNLNSVFQKMKVPNLQKREIVEIEKFTEDNMIVANNILEFFKTPRSFRQYLDFLSFGIESNNISKKLRSASAFKEFNNLATKNSEITVDFILSKM